MSHLTNNSPLQTTMSMMLITSYWTHVLALAQNAPDETKMQQLCPQSEEFLAQLPTPVTITARTEPLAPPHPLLRGPSQQVPQNPPQGHLGSSGSTGAVTVFL